MAREWTIGRAVSELTAAFSDMSFDTPRLDARILVGHAVKLEPSLLFARADQVLTDEESALVRAFAARRQQHEPVSRITGHRGFWGLDFLLSSETLDPRPDTETVVEAVIKNNTLLAPRILDLGTGSGCILLALLNDLPQAAGLGVDLQAGAVAAASANAARLGLDGRATFQCGDWCDGLDAQFDIVVSNPPYIAEHEMAHLSPSVTRFDPHAALVGGDDGLAAYRALIPGAMTCLAPQGRLYLEIGAGQAPAVGELLAAAGFKQSTEYRDLAGNIRCLGAIKL
jgi:release factor glutamine methyltransferase